MVQSSFVDSSRHSQEFTCAILHVHLFVASTSYHAGLTIMFLCRQSTLLSFCELHFCRIGMLALHDCTLVALVGCMFKSCGKGGGCGLQFGGSSSNISSTSSMANNRSKSFGATLTRCFITSCGEVSGGASLEVVAGSNVQLQRCTVAFSLGVSIHVDQSSTILLNKCSIYAAAAAALVFGEKSTGQVLFCQVLSSSGNGLELQGYINLWFHNV